MPRGKKLSARSASASKRSRSYGRRHRLVKLNRARRRKNEDGDSNG